jgi:hypothetical protein
MTNNSINPNNNLEPFYSNVVLVKDVAIFGGSKYPTYSDATNGIVAIVGVFDLMDNTIHTPIILPKNTKKASIRVLVNEGVIAPKFPAFVNMNGKIPFDFDYGDPPYNLATVSNPESIALLEGSELEIYGIENIRKLMFFNNRVIISGSGAIIKYNTTPVPFLLNITLFK